MIRKTFLIALALFLSAGPSFGQSLKDMRARDGEEAALARQAAYTESVCGHPVRARIDWRSAADWPEDASLAQACDGALSAVEALCRSGRKGVVRNFVCAGDGSGPDLSGATLRYGASPRGGAFSETMDYLGE